MNLKKRLLYAFIACFLVFVNFAYRHFSGGNHKEVETHTRVVNEVRSSGVSGSLDRATITKSTPAQNQTVDNSRLVQACNALEQLISRTKTGDCSTVFEYTRDCIDRTNFGRTPLPNFFTGRNNNNNNNNGDEEETTNDAYRQANVAFVHMPKAGGTSVENVLLRMPGLNKTGMLRRMRVAHCRDLYRHSLHFRNFRDQTFFYSKRTFGLHAYAYPKRPFAYTTWFREPIDRLISTYFYTKRKHCFGVHKICIHYLARSKNLTDYLLNTQDIHFQDMDNFYVRLLQFGDFPEVDATFEDCCGGVKLEDVKTIPKIEEKHYLVARNNLLTKVAFVGLTEDFKTSQDILSHVFGIPLQKEETHINANPHDKYEVTDFELAELRRRNEWDLKLYDEAKKIYERQKKEYLEMMKKS